MSQITTHILDTSRGQPASGVGVALHQWVEQKWIEIAVGHSNRDGRVSDLLKPDLVLPEGNCKLIFATGDYYHANNSPCFYPFVEIQFHIVGDGQHYHVPLLLNPFGYTTYRGS